MKKIYTLFVSLLLTAAIAHSQIHLFLQEQEINVKDTKSAAWVFPVARDLDEAIDDLKDYTKDRSDVRMKNDGDNQVIAEKVSIPSIVTKRGDLIGNGFITENYYGIALIFQLGYDISVNSEEYPAEMANFRNYAKAFMAYHYEQSYSRRIEDLEKEIKSQERQKGQNEGKIENMYKRIDTLTKRNAKEDDEAKIASNNSEITTLESDIQELSDTLPQIQNQIDSMQANMDKLKNESNSFQFAIGSI